MFHSLSLLLGALVSFSPATPLATQSQPVLLDVDARQVSRGILYVHEHIPVTAGSFRLVYPKWIPGEHGPTGPLNNLAALRFATSGKALSWRRDPLDMWSFIVDVPGGATSLDADFDVLMNAPGDVMATHNVAVINWNRVLLYQNGIESHHYFVKPFLHFPSGWTFGTALTGSGIQTGEFDPVSLAMLVDSPLDMGAHVKKFTLFKSADTLVEMDAFADNPQDLDVPKDLIKAYTHVPGEAFALYGSRHFNNYHALLTLSDAIGSQGIEHHQSSDDREADDFLTNPVGSLQDGDLITHEFSHSWNGKYRRPDDLTTPNFQVPQQTDLLWIYEGMNQYLGDLLSFRSGIRDAKLYPEYLASLYASMDTERGRDTTPLIDLTTGAPYFFSASGEYYNIRRNAGDFYTEGELVWLDVDTIIRQETGGKKSLDSFLHLLTAPELTGPITKTYTREDVETLLHQVASYDWHAFFQTYVYNVAVHPPADEISRAGWKLVYTSKPNIFVSASSARNHNANFWYSIGIKVNSKGAISDVRLSSPAWNAGIAGNETIVAVNGQGYSADVMNSALASAEHNTPITLLVQQDGWFNTYAISYQGGTLFPHLVRESGKPDMLEAIMKPHAQ